MCIGWPMICMMMLYDVKMLYMWCNVYMMTHDMHDDAMRCEYAIYVMKCVYDDPWYMMMLCDVKMLYMWCNVYMMTPFYAWWFYAMWKCYIWTNETHDDAMWCENAIYVMKCVYDDPWYAWWCYAMWKCYICDAMRIWWPILCMLILCDVKMLYMDKRDTWWCYMMRKCYICDEMCIWRPMKCMMMLRCEKCDVTLCDVKILYMCVWPRICTMTLCDVKMLHADVMWCEKKCHVCDANDGKVKGSDTGAHRNTPWRILKLAKDKFHYKLFLKK